LDKRRRHDRRGVSARFAVSVDIGEDNLAGDAKGQVVDAQ
jgi:hypothetical protein